MYIVTHCNRGTFEEGCLEHTVAEQGGQQSSSRVSGLVLSSSRAVKVDWYCASGQSRVEVETDMSDIRSRVA